MIAVTWPMVFVLLGGAAVIFALFLVAFELRSGQYFKEIKAQVDRVVPVADAANAQYQAVKAEVATVRAETERAHARLDGFVTDVGLVKRKLGM